MFIHRKQGGKLESRLKYNNAAATNNGTKSKSPAVSKKLTGAPVVSYSTPYRYVDRKITPDILADFQKVPIIFSSFTFLNRLCFGGLDFKLESIDGPEDDTKQDQIDEALKQIKKADRKLARIGRNKHCTTLDCIRKASLETWSYNKAFFERIFGKLEDEGNVYVPKLQHLPSQSFNRTPTNLATDAVRYNVDPMLKGVVFDTEKLEPLFYQNFNPSKDPIEIKSDQLIYIEDKSVPENTSLLHSIASTIEFMKESRNDFRLAMKRIGTPKEVASIDAASLAQLKQAGIDIEGGYQTLINYANEIVVGQSANQAEVALPGIKFQYPNIPIPLNPMDVEKFIEQIILNHFFGKAITEQLAQAISVSSTPGKALLDTVISGYQEVSGSPFVQMWQENFLDVNGYELVISFDFWSWTPKDRMQEFQQATTMFNSGGSLINDYRAAQGLEPYTDEQIAQLYEEQNALKRGRIPGQEMGGFGGFGGGQSPFGQPESSPEEPEEEELTDEEQARLDEIIGKLNMSLGVGTGGIPLGISKETERT